MRQSHHQSPKSLLLISPLVLGLATILASCGESKVSQCNRLVAEINQGQTVYQKSGDAIKGFGVLNPTKPEEVKTQVAKINDSLKVFVTDIRKVNQNIKSLAVEDPKLKELRDNYYSKLETVALGFEDSGKAISSLGAVNFTAPDAVKQIEASTKGVSESIQKAGKAGQESNQVVGEINTYCGAK